MKSYTIIYLFFCFVLVTCANVCASASDDKGRVVYDEFLKHWILDLRDTSQLDLSCLENIDNLSKVEWVWLGGNKIAQIDTKHLAKCENLKKLVLSDNNIKVITVAMFSCLKKLEYLDISRNPIKSIEPGALECLAETLKELLVDKEFADGQKISVQLKKELPETEIIKVWPKSNSSYTFPSPTIFRLVPLHSPIYDFQPPSKEMEDGFKAQHSARK